MSDIHSETQIQEAPCRAYVRCKAVDKARTFCPCFLWPCHMGVGCGLERFPVIKPIQALKKALEPYLKEYEPLQAVLLIVNSV